MSSPKAVAKVFSEVLGVPEEAIGDDFSPRTSPLWDSLQAMNLVMALEDEYAVKFSTREILAMQTVGLVKEVLAKKGMASA